MSKGQQAVAMTFIDPASSSLTKTSGSFLWWR
jgi:hypothetical protein